MHVQLSDVASDLDFSLSLYLLPYFVHASSKGTDESAQLHRLTTALDVAL